MKLRCMLLTACLIAGCSPAPTEETASDQPVRAATDFSRLPAIIAGIGDPAELFEGLPSAFWEPQLRETESVSKSTIVERGFRLYEDQPVLTPADSEQLSAIFADSRSFKPYDSQKPCGEFHADYCVAWHAAGKATEAFVSLECGEVMLFGPQGDVHCDLTPEVARQLKTLLASYQEHRPTPE